MAGKSCADLRSAEPAKVGNRHLPVFRTRSLPVAPAPLGRTSSAMGTRARYVIRSRIVCGRIVQQSRTAHVDDRQPSSPGRGMEEGWQTPGSVSCAGRQNRRRVLVTTGPNGTVCLSASPPISLAVFASGSSSSLPLWTVLVHGHRTPSVPCHAKACGGWVGRNCPRRRRVITIRDMVEPRRTTANCR